MALKGGWKEEEMSISVFFDSEKLIQGVTVRGEF